MQSYTSIRRNYWSVTRAVRFSLFCARHWKIEDFQPLYISDNKNTVIGFWSSVDPIQPWSCSWSITTLINSTENLTGVLEKDESFEAVDTGLATSILHGLPNWVNSNVSMSIPAPLTWDSPLKENNTYTMSWVGRIMLTHHRKCFQFSLQCVEIYNNKVSCSFSDPAVKDRCTDILRDTTSYQNLSPSWFHDSEHTTVLLICNQ